jgi:hypothetical protein
MNVGAFPRACVSARDTPLRFGILHTLAQRDGRVVSAS